VVVVGGFVWSPLVFVFCSSFVAYFFVLAVVCFAFAATLSFVFCVAATLCLFVCSMCFLLFAFVVCCLLFHWSSSYLPPVFSDGFSGGCVGNAVLVGVGVILGWWWV
jgi:hypothetical protein